MIQTPFPVFLKRGDARSEVDEILTELGMDAEAAGLRKSLFVAQAHQTVVMVATRDAPLAAALRERKGWAEPEE